MPLVAVPNFSEGRSDRVIARAGGDARVARQGPQPPLRRRAQPLRLHDRRREPGQAGRGADRRRGARDRPDRHAPPPGAPSRTSGRSTSARSSGRPRTDITTRWPRRGRTAEGIADLGIPVFFYGELASEPGARRARLLPGGRPGRAGALRMKSGELEPDLGPGRAASAAPAPPWSPRGSRWSLSTWSSTPRTRRSRARSPPSCARRVADCPGVRALGLPREGERTQVSMNIHDPYGVPLAVVVAEVTRLADGHGARADRGGAGRARPRGRPRRLPGPIRRSGTSTRSVT